MPSMPSKRYYGSKTASRRVLRRRRMMQRRKKNRSNKIYTSVIRGPAIAPDKYMCKLVYNDVTFNSLTNNLSFIANQPWQVNGAYDIDPRLGNAAIAGFNELAALYKYYRVNAVKYTIQVVNNQTFPLQVFAVPLHDNPTSSDPNVLDYPMNPYAKRLTLSAKGGMDRGILRGYINICKFVGSKTAEYEYDYRALTNANPQNLIYLSLGIAGMGGNTLTTNGGICYTIRITQYIQFYERKVLTG